jgi:Kef-type K+ transport system membrane component KefB/Trk K+ transport system NAD-binding subunit
VGEILAGVAIGRSGLGLIHEEFTLELLAEIGFAFLMFLSGLEMDFALLLNPGRRSGDRGLHPFAVAGISLLLTALFAVFVGLLVVRSGLARDPWWMALVLSTTSLGIVVPVLKEREMSTGYFGQTLLLATLLADFLTMFLITVYIAILSSGLTLEILLIGLLFIAFLLIYHVGGRQIGRPRVRRLIKQLSGATSQIQVRGALALMMAFVVLAKSVNVELILGAFLAGAVASLLRTPGYESARQKLEAMGYGFFVPVFFIMVGIDFDLPALLSEPAALFLTPTLLVAAFLIKFLAALVFKFNFSWRETLAAGSLLSARLSLIIAAAAIGLRVGVITEATNAAIILVAALTSTWSPLLFNALLPTRDEIPGQRRFLIYGAANIGLQVGQELRAHGERVCFLEPEPQRAKLVRKEGFRVIEGDATVESLHEVGVSKAEALLVLSGDDDRNYSMSKTAADVGLERIIVLINDPKRVAEFKNLGVRTFAAAMYEATLLALMARNPSFVSLLTTTSDQRDVREIRLRNPVLAGKRIGDLVLPGDSLILTVARDGELLIPHGTTRLKAGDLLTVLGDISALDNVQHLMNRYASR